MEAETAYWFLSTLAQVLATIVGFVIVATVFWLRIPIRSEVWRFVTTFFIALLIGAGVLLSLQATITIAMLPVGTLASEDVAAMSKYIDWIYAYALIAILTIGMILYTTALSASKKEKEELGKED